jgi:hypothetical protein
MRFDLTISRTGALAGAAIRTTNGQRRLCDTKIVGTFREQAEDLWQRPPYKAAEKAILDVIGDKTRSDKPVEFLKGGLARGGGLESVQVTTMPSDPDEAPRAAPGVLPAIVALLPARRVRCEVDGIPWVVRTRASVTACALQQQNGLAKVWWTFEGIPQSDPLVRPSETQAANFLQLTEQMAEAALPGLRKAFRESLRKVSDAPIGEYDTQDDAIRISIADTDDQPVGALFDALYFSNQLPSDIRKEGGHLPDALQGLNAFETFVDAVAGVEPPIEDRKVSTNDSAPGARAVLFRETEKPVVTIAGFARHAGPSIALEFLSPAQQREEKSEDYVRATSAARPISARLAGDHAIALEARAHKRIEPGARLTLS